MTCSRSHIWWGAELRLEPGPLPICSLVLFPFYLPNAVPREIPSGNAFYAWGGVSSSEPHLRLLSTEHGTEVADGREGKTLRVVAARTPTPE